MPSEDDGLFVDFSKLRAEGATSSEASRAVGRSAAWGSEQSKSITELLRPELSEVAVRALNDFAFFRRVFLGHISLPWHIEAQEHITRLALTDEREFTVMNVAPGVGKTTLLIDLALWLICRDRSVRILLGSKSSVNADRMLMAVRRELDRKRPALADAELVAAGMATQATHCLATEFGSFRPLERDVPWKATGFEVQRYDGDVSSNKEPTVSSYGQNSGVLGNRFNYVFWDDLVDSESTGTAQAIAKQRHLWDTELESRLEPRGLMALVGQRIAAGDLYRYVLDKRYTDEAGQEHPKYHHIVFPAHFDDLCSDVHAKASAREWPIGCLLDPQRLPWTGKGGISQIRDNNPQAFEVLYQQRDGDPDGGLIRDVWLCGGIDHHDGGAIRPGCFDRERVYGEMPAGVAKDSLRIASVDPSGTKSWAVQDWLMPKDAHTRLLLNVFDGKMSADELLDWNAEGDRFKGIMHDWQLRSIEQGLPIKYWIVENNAAQRYLLAYDHVRRWAQRYRVTIKPHTTTAKNKLDPELGPQTLREPHRAGLVRYAYGDRNSVGKTEIIRQQLTTFPSPAYKSDQVMAEWMASYHIPSLQPRTTTLPIAHRPTWLAPKQSRRGRQAGESRFPRSA